MATGSLWGQVETFWRSGPVVYFMLLKPSSCCTWNVPRVVILHEAVLICVYGAHEGKEALLQTSLIKDAFHFPLDDGKGGQRPFGHCSQHVNLQIHEGNSTSSLLDWMKHVVTDDTAPFFLVWCGFTRIRLYYTVYSTLNNVAICLHEVKWKNCNVCYS